MYILRKNLNKIIVKYYVLIMVILNEIGIYSNIFIFYFYNIGTSLSVQQNIQQYWIENSRDFLDDGIGLKTIIMYSDMFLN